MTPDPLVKFRFGEVLGLDNLRDTVLYLMNKTTFKDFTSEKTVGEGSGLLVPLICYGAVVDLTFLLLRQFLCKGKTKWIRAKLEKEFAKAVHIIPAEECQFEAVRYSWDDYPCYMKMCAICSGNLSSPPFIKYGPFEKI